MGALTMTQLAAVASLAMLTAVSAAEEAGVSQSQSNLSVAERLVDAFYSFDPEPLGNLLDKARDAKADLLFYQGWALGGNYIVMQRRPCEVVDDNTVSCAITVQDDLVLALGIDFDVTDTFILTFEDGAVSAFDLSTDDPQLYLDAREWVWKNRPELVAKACNGDAGAKPDPDLCVKNALKGYKEFARLNGLTPRAPSSYSSSSPLR